MTCDIAASIFSTSNVANSRSLDPVPACVQLASVLFRVNPKGVHLETRNKEGKR